MISNLINSDSFTDSFFSTGHWPNFGYSHRGVKLQFHKSNAICFFSVFTLWKAGPKIHFTVNNLVSTLRTFVYSKWSMEFAVDRASSCSYTTTLDKNLFYTSDYNSDISLEIKAIAVIFNTFWNLTILVWNVTKKYFWIFGMLCYKGCLITSLCQVQVEVPIQCSLSLGTTFINVP